VFSPTGVIIMLSLALAGVVTGVLMDGHTKYFLHRIKKLRIRQAKQNETIYNLMTDKEMITTRNRALLISCEHYRKINKKLTMKLKSLLPDDKLIPVKLKDHFKVNKEVANG
jgi:uncharacterized coiled-coil protein SlyX